jgi:hypothetical protein
MGSPPTVSVHNDLASSESRIAHRAANDEISTGVDVEHGFLDTTFVT